MIVSPTLSWLYHFSNMLDSNREFYDFLEKLNQKEKYVFFKRNNINTNQLSNPRLPEVYDFVRYLANIFREPTKEEIQLLQIIINSEIENQKNGMITLYYSKPSQFLFYEAALESFFEYFNQEIPFSNGLFGTLDYYFHGSISEEDHYFQTSPSLFGLFGTRRSIFFKWFNNLNYKEFEPLVRELFFNEKVFEFLEELELKMHKSTNMGCLYLIVIPTTLINSLSFPSKINKQGYSTLQTSDLIQVYSDVPETLDVFKSDGEFATINNIQISITDKFQTKENIKVANANLPYSKEDLEYIKTNFRRFLQFTFPQNEQEFFKVSDHISTIKKKLEPLNV